MKVRWNHVSKKPEIAGEYLVWVNLLTGRGKFLLSWWDGSKFSTASKVVYWTNLPAPPQVTPSGHGKML